MATILLSIAYISFTAAKLVFTGMCLAIGFYFGNELKDYIIVQRAISRSKKDPAYKDLFPTKYTFADSVKDDMRSIANLFA